MFLEHFQNSYLHNINVVIQEGWKLEGQPSSRLVQATSEPHYSHFLIIIQMIIHFSYKVLNSLVFKQDLKNRSYVRLGIQ